MNLDPATAAIIFFGLLIGAVSKGVTGFGLPIVAVPLLAGVLGVERAVVVMVIPTFVTNAMLLWEHRRRAGEAWRVLPIFLAAGVIGTVCGTMLLKALSDRALVLILATWLGLYLLTQALHPSGLTVPERGRNVLNAVVGVVAGVLQGSMGVPGPVVATWFHALRLDPATYVFAVCAVFFLTAGVQIGSLANFGLWTGDRFAEGLLALVPSVLGIPLGVRLARRLDAKQFNRWLMAVLILMEVRLIWQGLFE
jgi:uncharacterized membrane protein YfcA